MQQLIIDLEKKENFLETMYRVKGVFEEESLKNFEEDDDVNFTAD